MNILADIRNEYALSMSTHVRNVTAKVQAVTPSEDTVKRDHEILLVYLKGLVDESEIINASMQGREHLITGIESVLRANDPAICLVQMVFALIQ